MKTLYSKSDISEILFRLEKLNSDSKNKWGKMNAAQMLAHCNESIETAQGKKVLKPVFFIGRLIGRLLKHGALSEKPFGKNSPTDKTYIFPPDVKFEEQKTKVIASIKQFHADGPSKATTHPHPFFGHFTQEEWGVIQWKHLDHHLRQFGV